MAQTPEQRKEANRLRMAAKRAANKAINPAVKKALFSKAEHNANRPRKYRGDCSTIGCCQERVAYSTLCPDCRTEKENEESLMIDTIMLALKRGYPTLESCFPTLKDLIAYLQAKVVINQCFAADADEIGCFIPGFIDLGHLTDFAVGGDCSTGNIYPMGAGVNSANRRVKATVKVKPLTNKKVMRQQAIELYGSDWVDRAAEMMGQSRNDFLRWKRGQRDRWQDALALATDNPDFHTMNARQARDALGFSYTKTYWHLLATDRWAPEKRVAHKLNLNAAKRYDPPTDLFKRLVAEAHTTAGLTDDLLDELAKVYPHGEAELLERDRIQADLEWARNHFAEHERKEIARQASLDAHAARLAKH